MSDAALAILGKDELRVGIEPGGRNANDPASVIPQFVRNVLALGYRRQENDPVHLQSRYESQDVVRQVFAAIIAGVRYQFVAGGSRRIQDAKLHLGDVLRVRIVVNEPENERTAAAQPARAGVGREIQRLDGRLDLDPRRAAHLLRLVENARNGHWGNTGDFRNVGYRYTIALFVGVGLAQVSTCSSVWVEAAGLGQCIILPDVRRVLSKRLASGYAGAVSGGPCDQKRYLSPSE